jgi:hypothetical protein
MKTGQAESVQTMQRVRVGITGLGMVLVLIALASVIFTSANREKAVEAVGASNAQVVANITEPGNSAAAKDEPLAELGLTPSTASTEAVDAGAIARRQQGGQQK